MQVILNKLDISLSPGFLATIGKFDGVHLGHLYLLEELVAKAKERGLQSLVVTFANTPQSATDNSRELKCITTVSERLSLIEKAGVDACLLLEFSEELRKKSAGEFLDYLKTEYGVKGILTGFNNSFGSKSSGLIPVAKQIEDKGLSLIHCTEYHLNGVTLDISSSTIRTLLDNGKVSEARLLLGRPYDLTGIVTSGQKIGRVMGFPTANLLPIDLNKIIPVDGVYACEANLQKQPDMFFPAMVNIGRRPTVGNQTNSTIEAHIIGLPGDTDLYDTWITIGFHKFIRHEKKFHSMEELKKQLSEDKETTIRCLKSDYKEPFQQTTIQQQ